MDDERDTVKQKRWWLLAATAAAGMLAVNTPKVKRMLTVNDVTTGRTPEYPELQPRVYRRSMEDVITAAVETCEGLGWRVVTEDRVDWRVYAEVPVPPAFTDDFDVRFSDTEEGVLVMVRSRARVGRGDLGFNAGHVRSFQREMDRRLRR